MEQQIATRTIDQAAGKPLADVVAGFAVAEEWVRTELPNFDPAVAIGTRFGAIPLDEYSRTRLLELVVHGFDLAAAAQCDFTPPPAALVDVLYLLGDIAVTTEQAAGMIRSLTGRSEPAPVLLR